jgi:hypothetical protein
MHSALPMLSAFQKKMRALPSNFICSIISHNLTIVFEHSIVSFRHFQKFLGAGIKYSVETFNKKKRHVVRMQ